MEYEVVKSRHDPTGTEWRVEAINYPPEGDGEGYLAIFSGPKAKERAEEYAALKTAKEVRGWLPADFEKRSRGLGAIMLFLDDPKWDRERLEPVRAIFLLGGERRA